MGCAGSKHRTRCSNCRGESSPAVVPRSFSMNVHHPAQHSGDSYHTVSLTSSTFGSLTLCDSPFRHIHKHVAGTTREQHISGEVGEKKVFSGDGFHHGDERKELEVMGLDLQAKIIEAKVWSSMMNEKIPKVVPKTPIGTPPGEPETINTWELMEGLDDVSPLRSPNHIRSFSFDVVRIQPCNDDEDDALFHRPKSRFHESNSRFDDLDPPGHPFRIPKPLEEEKEEAKWQRKALGKERLILYFTSLRGIRKTYEDCCNVRVILKSLGIRIDERDVSMHSGFKDELKKLLEGTFNSGVGITLPRVFLGDKYLGGVEEIKKLNENGTLEKLLEGCEKVEDGFMGIGNECAACGDVRFVPCETCSGSCKVYYDDDDDDEEEEDEDEEEEGTEYGFQRCPDCNENGLIRCPICCDVGIALIHGRRAFSHCPSRIEAELQALLWAMESMKDLRKTCMIFEFSALGLESMIKQPQLRPHYRHLTKEISHLLSLNPSWKLSSTSVTSNQIASRIANSVTQELMYQSYVKRGGPNWLQDFILDEARRSTGYCRIRRSTGVAGLED